MRIHRWGRRSSSGEDLRKGVAQRAPDENENGENRELRLKQSAAAALNRGCISFHEKDRP